MNNSEFIIIASIAYLSYRYYKQKSNEEPLVVDEKDLVPITKLDHNKDYNPLWNGDQQIKIEHHYKTQVMPQVVASASHPYSTLTANM